MFKFQSGTTTRQYWQQYRCGRFLSLATIDKFVDDTLKPSLQAIDSIIWKPRTGGSYLPSPAFNTEIPCPSGGQ